MSCFLSTLRTLLLGLSPPEEYSVELGSSSAVRSSNPDLFSTGSPFRSASKLLPSLENTSFFSPRSSSETYTRTFTSIGNCTEMDRNVTKTYNSIYNLITLNWDINTSTQIYEWPTHRELQKTATNNWGQHGTRTEPYGSRGIFQMEVIIPIPLE